MRRESVVTSKIFKGFGLATAMVTLALAGCATEPSSGGQGTPKAEAAPGGRMESEAIAFESYMRRARGIDPNFSSADQVSQALQAGASHEPAQLEAGMVAYAAMAALQEPSFVAGVQREAQRGDLARRLAADPGAALQLPGGQAAAARASAALLSEAEGVKANGQRVKRASYSVQHQAWSKTRVADPGGRLARVKRLSATSYRPEPGDEAHLREALATDARRGGGSASPVVARGVALAALSVLGDEGRGRSLMSDARSDECLHMAKLNLYQCLAAAGPQYEDVYCLGQHAMIDTGQCVADAAHAPAPRRMTPTRASWGR
jgi:hypothetical protein